MAETSVATIHPVTPQEKLRLLKARCFPPETKEQRIARARDALAKARIPMQVDSATLKQIAQGTDLEGF